MSEDQSRGRRLPLEKEKSPILDSEVAKRAKLSSQSEAQDEAAASTSSSAAASARALAAATQPVHKHGAARNRNERFDIVATRPANVERKQGAEGKPICLQTNYYRIRTKPHWCIAHYNVDMTPEIESVRVRCGILSEHAKLFAGGYLFDGKQLFSTVKLPNDRTELQGTSKSGFDYTICIKFIGFISTVETRFLQVLNLILRRSMQGLKLELIGRNMFDPEAKIKLREHNMEIWPGYRTSIRQHEKDILLCVEVTHKVLRTETVYDILVRSSQNPAGHQEEFCATVLGQIVLTDYNNKSYRINDVDFTQTPRSVFSCKGRDVSFIEYYMTRYNIAIRDHNQPLLVSKIKGNAQRGNNEIVLLIPELCRLTGLTEDMRDNFHFMRTMSDHTRLNPERRIERLRIFNQRLQSTPASVKALNDWNMTLEGQLQQVQGRVLDAEKIVFKDKKSVTAGEQTDWSRCFRNEKMLTAPVEGLDRWAVVALERHVRDLRNLLTSLSSVAHGMGLIIRNPTEMLIYDDRTASYIRAIDDCARMDPKLILCLVANNNVERYSSIKKRGCIDRAIPTQVVIAKTVQNRGLMSIATKIAIQLNCKLGYTPWMIKLPLSGLMTIGFDIAKSTRDRSKAFGALVASMDLQKNSTYFSTVAECSAYDVMANSLWPMIAKALRQYRHEQGSLPARIVLYRDGVSLGSLKQLMEYEVKDVVEKLTEEYQKAGAAAPKMAYIVVNKSSNTRFFVNGRCNPPPGTVIDDVVTLPERYDFYLVSQTVRHGTVSPTNYNVVYSNIGLTPDRMQMLTYKMCHLYYNWLGTTRVPAVCQYAKKLATLVATNLHAIPHSSLEKKFYYL